MKWKDYASSQLIDQGTLLKKFNKLIDIIEETKVPKIYHFKFDLAGLTLEGKLISSTPITKQNLIDNVYKITFAIYDGDNNIFKVDKVTNDSLYLHGNSPDGTFFGQELSVIEDIEEPYVIGDL